jgi:hypothetical protein
MRKVLKPESPLHFLPKELGNEVLMTFDSLRFTLEMIDHCHLELIKCLENLALQKENKIHFKIFHYTWSIIDHSHRFSKIYKTLNPPENSVIHNLNYLENFRNAIQHVDKNLKKSSVKMLDNGRPIYGALKWVVYDSEKNETYTSLLISGIFNIDNIKFTQHAQNGYPNLINEIVLETDTMKKEYDNEISISKLIEDIEDIINKVDANLNETINSKKLQRLDWKSRKDVLLNMKNP